MCNAFWRYIQNIKHSQNCYFSKPNRMLSAEEMVTPMFEKRKKAPSTVNIQQFVVFSNISTREGLVVMSSDAREARNEQTCLTEALSNASKMKERWGKEEEQKKKDKTKTMRERDERPAVLAHIDTYGIANVSFSFLGCSLVSEKEKESQ